MNREQLKKFGKKMLITNEDIIKKIENPSRCVKENTQERKENFLRRSKKVHGNRYDYSKSVYHNRYSKIIITCRTHGDFEQTPGSHMRGRGCKVCAGNVRSNTQSFIQKSKKIHGSLYNYNKVNYLNAFTSVIITCPKHGNFYQTPHDHLNGRKCRRCGYEKRHINNGFKWKSFIFPDGESVELQGYEYLTTNYLISESIDLNEIKVGISKRPVVYYEWSGSIHLYHPDCYLKTSNVLVETKSSYTWEFEEEKNKAKISGSLLSGYNIRVIVWNRKKELQSDMFYSRV